MSEGELYKSLIEYYDENGKPHYGYEETGIVQRLDEAKKEFPMTEQQIQILTGCVSTESALDAVKAPDPQEVAEWFKKYFGEKHEN